MSAPQSNRPRVAILAFDLEEASQIRAIRAMRLSGTDVVSLSYRRGHMNSDFRPEWRDVPLGAGSNGVGFSRLSVLLRGALRVWRNAPSLGDIEVIVARNLDMALLALVLRLRLRRRVPLIYQCFDVHGLMTGGGLPSRMARWAERRVLARCSRLVVSAPAFLERYFTPVQRYTGPAMVVENRIFWGGPTPPRPKATQRCGPIRLGWVGTLRCPQTLDLLAGLADRLGPEQISIHMRGVVHRHQLPHLDEALRGRVNLHYDGRYGYPQGLSRAYAGLDAVWAQDLWQPGANSDWLLPNRIYEAGYFGCPAIAVWGTATGARIIKDQSGLVVDEATVTALATLLLGNRDALGEISQRLLFRPVEDFCQPLSEVQEMLTLPPPTIRAPMRRSRSRAGIGSKGQTSP